MIGANKIKLMAPPCLIRIIIALLLMLALFHLWSARNSNQISYFMIGALDIDQSRASLSWPPENAEDLLDTLTGYYNLTIPVRQGPLQTDQTDTIQTYVKYLEHMYKNEKSKYSALKYYHDMDNKARLGSQWKGTGNNFDLYPIAANLVPIVEAVRLGKPVSHTPINNPELHAIRIPTSVCYSNGTKERKSLDQYDLVVMIKSCSHCEDRRQTVRQTFAQQKLWSNFSIGFVFVVAMPMDNGSHEFNFDGFQVQFPESRWSARRKRDTESFVSELPLLEESERYGDMLIGSFADTYYNLTLKLMMSFRWATVFCRSQTNLFMYMDDDYALIPQNTINLVRSIPPELKPDMAAGGEFGNEAIHRPSWNSKKNQHSISYDEMPFKTYPPYPIGVAYLIGSKVVQDIAIGSAFIRYLRFDDAYVGFAAYKLRKIFLRLPGVLSIHQAIKNKNEVICALLTKVDKVYNWKTGSFY